MSIPSESVFAVGLLFGIVFGGVVGLIAGMLLEDAFDNIRVWDKYRGKRSHSKKK